MGYLVPHLRRLNRKERFFLVGLALGNEAFRLGCQFREDLSDILGLSIPEDAFVAMDYHLDWLFAAIHLAATSGAPGPHPRGPRLITGTQEDIDLLLAFDAEGESHVIMLEAKGVTSYSNRQFESKVRRLHAAFMAPQAKQVVPHLVLASPARPRFLRYDSCPPWMLGKDGQVAWLQLPVPSDMQKIVRCTKRESQTSMGTGGSWSRRAASLRMRLSPPREVLPGMADRNRALASHSLRKGPAPLDSYRGTLLGVAVGDALGAPVEFLRWEEIKARYGPEGVKGFVPGHYGLGAVTDDTQMTLATASGLLAADGAVLRGDLEAATRSVYAAYLEWLATQDDPRQRRAPGLTCLSALRSGVMGTVERPLNDSKGCGGVMRVAPVGLALPGLPDEAFSLGVRIAAITHGHPGGYIPAGVLAALVSRLVAQEDLTDAVAAEQSRRELDPGTRTLLVRAVHLARDGDLSPVRAIETLGQGWTADEALAIAVYCALRYAGLPRSSDFFRKALLASVNHSGDSDSTGAVTGAILGAWLGADSIPAEWFSQVEGVTEIFEVALKMLVALA